MVEEVVHEGIDVAKDACNLQLDAADHTPEIALFGRAVRGLFLDVAFGEEYPSVADAGLGGVDVGVDDCFFFAVASFSGYCEGVCVTAEVARSALPDFFGVVHA